MKEVNFDFTVWVKKGEMLVQRMTLPPSDPDSLFSLWRDKFGFDMPSEVVSQIWGPDQVSYDDIREAEETLSLIDEKELLAMGAFITD